MHIKACKSREHIYYAVVQSKRRENDVFQEYLLKLGRLDNLTEPQRIELDIDLTSTYFEDEECVLAEFGYPRGHSKDKLQIVVAFVVDQKGVIVTHKVWPGNRTDAKSLKPMDRSIKLQDTLLRKAKEADSTLRSRERKSMSWVIFLFARQLFSFARY